MVGNAKNLVSGDQTFIRHSDSVKDLGMVEEEVIVEGKVEEKDDHKRDLHLYNYVYNISIQTCSCQI